MAKSQSSLSNEAFQIGMTKEEILKAIEKKSQSSLSNEAFQI